MSGGGCAHEKCLRDGCDNCCFCGENLMVTVETHIENKHSHGKGPGEITGSGIIPCPIVDDFQEQLNAERQKLAQAVRVSMNEQMIEEAKTDL
jgi:hypothetical protein